MCFSAEADVAAGVVVGAIGFAALRRVGQKRELPLASLPALFAGHQLSEAFVGWDVTGRASATTGRVALWVYMLFAYVVLRCSYRPPCWQSRPTPVGAGGWRASRWSVGRWPPSTWSPWFGVPSG